MLFIAVIVFGSVLGLTWVGCEWFSAQKSPIKTRLLEIKISVTRKKDGLKDDFKDGLDEELETDIRDRILLPLIEKTTKLIQTYTPLKHMDYIEGRLTYAGHPFGWDTAEFLTVQYSAVFGMAVVFCLLGVMGNTGQLNEIMYTLGGIIFGYIMVELWLRSTIIRRQTAILYGLPDVLDLLTISVEAGLGFDAAVQRVVLKSKGPLAKEFNQALQEMRMGKTRREALRSLGLRNGVTELSKFTEAIIQADLLGVSLGNVLRHQADQMRSARRQKVQEKAMKAPIKMLIPMLLFIFPTIFLIILAPAFIQVLSAGTI